MVIRYKNVNGVVEREILASTPRHRRGEVPPQHQSEAILKSYYQLELRDGCRFRSGYTKNQIKKAHEIAIERFEQTGEE